MYGPNGGASTPPTRKVTVPEIRARKGAQPIAMVTAYDFTMARLFDEGKSLQLHLRRPLQLTQAGGERPSYSIAAGE